MIALDKLTTMAGTPLIDALKMLDTALDATAYQGRSDDLTSINAYAELELIETAFGPLGIGWGYEVLEMRNLAGIAVCAVDLWYETEQGIRIAWHARGHHESTDFGEAEAGALTNAITKGWSYQGLQRSVFKGLRTHDKTALPATPPPQGRRTPAATTKPQEPKPASKYQVRKIEDLALVMDAEKVLEVEKSCGLCPKGDRITWADLTSVQASSLIDALKAVVLE